jgi:hypothetical protein
MATKAVCARCGNLGELVSITDNFGDLGNRKIDVCLCKECERLRRANEPEFMRWLADHLRTVSPKLGH